MSTRLDRHVPTTDAVDDVAIRLQFVLLSSLGHVCEEADPTECAVEQAIANSDDIVAEIFRITDALAGRPECPPEYVELVWSQAIEALDSARRHLQHDVPRHRPTVRAATRSGLTRQADRLVELMRVLATTWPDMVPEMSEEQRTMAWTVLVPPPAYLRAMWNLFWSAIRYPLSETTIDLSTGRVLYRT